MKKILVGFMILVSVLGGPLLLRLTCPSLDFQFTVSTLLIPLGTLVGALAGCVPLMSLEYILSRPFASRSALWAGTKDRPLPPRPLLQSRRMCIWYCVAASVMMIAFIVTSCLGVWLALLVCRQSDGFVTNLSGLGEWVRPGVYKRHFPESAGDQAAFYANSALGISWMTLLLAWQLLTELRAFLECRSGSRIHETHVFDPYGFERPNP